MIIVCENCTAKFNLDESLLSQKGSRVRCSQCGHLFVAFAKGYGPGKDIPTAANLVPPSLPDKDITEKQQPLSRDTSIPRQADTPRKGTDDIDLDTDLEIDFSDDEFDFDESDLDLNLELGDLTGQEAGSATMEEDPFPQKTPDSLDMDDDLNLELDLDMDDNFSLELDLDMDDLSDEDPLADMLENKSRNPDTVDTTVADENDDFSLELDLDLDDLSDEDPLADMLENKSRNPDAVDTTVADENDDFSLELDLDLDDLPAEDPLADMLENKSRNPDTVDTTVADENDDFSLELDLDLDDLSDEDPLADMLENKSRNPDAVDTTVADEDDDFSLELDLDLDDLPAEDPLADMLENELQTPDTDDEPDSSDNFSLEMDLNEVTPPPPSNDIKPSEPPVLPPEKTLSEEPNTKQAAVTESGDDIPISPTPPLDQIPLETEKKPSFIVKFFLLFVFILTLLLGAHAASLMTGTFIPYISDLKIPFLTELVKPPPPSPPPVRLVPDKKTINGRFETNQKEGILFVITGNIRNPSQVTCSNIKVAVSLLNTEKVKIKAKTIICGTTISDQQLTTLDMTAIDGLLTTPQNNASLAPGQSSPFMVVFSNLPDNLDNFTVTIKDFDQK